MAIGAKNFALSAFPSLERLMTLLNRRSARSSGLMEEMSGGLAALAVRGVAAADPDVAFPDPSRKNVSTIKAPTAATGTPHRSIGDNVGVGAADTPRPSTAAPQL